MGQEIEHSHFRYYDFHRFEKLLKDEMTLLREWFRDGRFSRRGGVAGLELEAWLVDPDGLPTPWNEQVIAADGTAAVVPELSQYNVEFNVDPRRIAGRGLAELSADLEAAWNHCDEAAQELGASLVAIGVLPTLTDAHLTLRRMSRLHRYQALNEQVLRLRQGKPIRLNVQGRERLISEHRDVMLEAATTSFQLHLQVPPERSVRYYNAAQIASAPLVAVAANSPFLFGKQLWEETRIPLFEQSVDVGEGRRRRVTFGSGYARDSLEEVFVENWEQFPILLPLAMQSPSQRLAHVRLLNGTIWRWNRPLIGFDDDGDPHLRIEQRVMPAGPTMIDMAANMALCYGLIESLASAEVPPESQLPFAAASDNFYRAARHGLDCEVLWLNGPQPLNRLVLTELLPSAAAGLRSLGVDEDLIAGGLSIIEARVRSGQTGAAWQRGFAERHGRDLPALLHAYRRRQRSGEPVHTWSFERERAPSPTAPRRSMLQVLDRLPDGLTAARAEQLDDLLRRPTLIHLPGRRPEPLFVALLLHGNEDVGWLAVQRLLQTYVGRTLPRALSIFIGNVAAARRNVRRLADQPDYNRVWSGSELDDTPAHALMRHVVDEMRPRNVFAAVDLHNNTGRNPMYTCVTRLDPACLQLAALFGRTSVFFQTPYGTAAAAFAEFTPSVTCECGKVGDEDGVRRAEEYLNACLNLAEIPRRLPADGELHLFHTIGVLAVPGRVEFDFAALGEGASGSRAPVELTLRDDLDRLNFQELPAGTSLGCTTSSTGVPIQMTDATGRNTTDEFLRVVDGRILLARPAIPSMFTLDRAVIRQDCLGYLMVRHSLG